MSLERLRASVADRYRIERELGQGGMMVRPVEANRQLVMVVNWIQELRRRTGGGR